MMTLDRLIESYGIDHDAVVDTLKGAHEEQLAFLATVCKGSVLDAALQELKKRCNRFYQIDRGDSAGLKYQYNIPDERYFKYFPNGDRTPVNILDQWYEQLNEEQLNEEQLNE